MISWKNKQVLSIIFGLFSPFFMGCQPETLRESVPGPANLRASNSAEPVPSSLEYLGEFKLPTGLIFQDTPIGGLSGITYDSKRNLYYAISDDRAIQGPARFYTLKIEFNPLLVTPVSVTPLVDSNNRPFPPYSVDMEGIALTSRDTLFISSEGDVEEAIAPFIKEFSREGKELKTLPLPNKFLPQNGQGIRNNLAFENLTLSPRERFLYTAPESALVQDGKPADLTQGTPIRFLQYDLATEEPPREFYYRTERVLTEPKSPEGFMVQGLAELLAWNETKLLCLERGFTEDVGTTVLLYEISLDNAKDIQGIESLNNPEMSQFQPLQKRLLLDLRNLNIPLDNLEGMTFGPNLPDGRRSLILVSDNNFNPLQVTQFLIFAITLEE